MTDTAAVYDELRAACLTVLSKHGVQAEHVSIDMLLSSTQARNALIRSKYNEGRAAGVKSEALLVGLAEEHGIKYYTVYEITHDRR